MPEKKKVLIDLGKLKDLYTGLGQVSLNFGQALLSMKEKEQDLDWHFLIPKGYEKEFGNPPVTEYLSAKRRYLPSLCPRYDLWHAIHQDSAYFPAAHHHTPYLLTIHDLNFLKEKSERKAQMRLQRLQKKADQAEALVFISEFAKAEATSALRIGDKSLHVIYNGVATTHTSSEKRPSFLPEGNYIFSIGAMVPKKNFHVLIGMLKEIPDYFLVIAGNNKNSYAEEFNLLAAKAGVNDRILLTGPVDDTVKDYLYKNCSAFCFPSLHEGFGLPVVEAMRYQKPIFISRLSSLPEIGREHTFYWDSFEPVYMATIFHEGMATFEREKEIRSKAMLEYSQRYTWKKNVEDYISLYKNILRY